jgi:hypothetical protein
MSVMDFLVSLWLWLKCNRLLSWDAHEVRLRCPDEVDGDIGI